MASAGLMADGVLQRVHRGSSDCQILTWLCVLYIVDPCSLISRFLSPSYYIAFDFQ